MQRCIILYENQKRIWVVDIMYLFQNIYYIICIYTTILVVYTVEYVICMTVKSCSQQMSSLNSLTAWLFECVELMITFNF